MVWRTVKIKHGCAATNVLELQSTNVLPVSRFENWAGIATICGGFHTVSGDCHPGCTTPEIPLTFVDSGLLVEAALEILKRGGLIAV